MIRPNNLDLRATPAIRLVSRPLQTLGDLCMGSEYLLAVRRQRGPQQNDADETGRHSPKSLTCLRAA